MQVCQAHWAKLRKAIDDRGLGGFGAKDGKEAFRSMVTELEGRAAENDFDPLMAAHNMIWSKGLEVCGLNVMGMNEDGSHKCPVCEAIKSYEAWWIEGPAEAMLTEAREKGLVPKPDDTGSTGAKEQR